MRGRRPTNRAIRDRRAARGRPNGFDDAPGQPAGGRQPRQAPGRRSADGGRTDRSPAELGAHQREGHARRRPGGRAATTHVPGPPPGVSRASIDRSVVPIVEVKAAPPPAIRVGTNGNSRTAAATTARATSVEATTARGSGERARSRRARRRASAAPGQNAINTASVTPTTGDEAPSSVGGFVRAERGLEALDGGGQDREGHQQVEPALARRTTASAPTARRPRPRAPRRSGGPVRRAAARYIRMAASAGRAGQHHLLRDRGAAEREPGQPAQRRQGGARRQWSAERCRPVARHQLVEEPAAARTGTTAGPRRRAPRGRPGTGSPPRPITMPEERTPRSPGACPRARRCDPAGAGRRARPARRPRSLVAPPGCARPSGTSGASRRPADSMNRRN